VNTSFFLRGFKGCLEKKHEKPRTEAVAEDWPGKLVDGLAGEKVRWTESLSKFDTQ